MPSGGHVIATNAATILLDGSSAKIARWAAIMTSCEAPRDQHRSRSITIQNGANLTTASSGFTNAGTVNIGANSTFTVGGANDYIQTGGTTTLEAASSVLAVPSGHSVDLSGGTFQGIGTVQGNVSNSGGTVMPGTLGTPGTLTITGNYTDPMGPTFIEQINPGSNGLLNVGGSASIGGTMLEVDLSPGFTPANGGAIRDHRDRGRRHRIVYRPRDSRREYHLHRDGDR